MQPSRFFTREQKARIIDAIRTAESNTSGEIRVHVERLCLGEPADRAAYLFEKLGMHKTSLRNGVLFFFSYDDHKLAILGDAGINAVVPDDFWNNILDVMSGKFREGDFTGGLETGILIAGTQLNKHFPYTPDDVNELPNDISFGEKV
jgi:uncharacterized membrane protein